MTTLDSAARVRRAGPVLLAETPEERINQVAATTDYLQAKPVTLRAHRTPATRLDDFKGSLRLHLERPAERHGSPPDRLAGTFQAVGVA